MIVSSGRDLICFSLTRDDRGRLAGAMELGIEIQRLLGRWARESERLTISSENNCIRANPTDAGGMT